MKHLYISLCILLSMVALPSRANAVSGGRLSENPQDLGVVAIIYAGPMNVRCTGVVIGPRTVLTAAHCVSYEIEGVFVPFYIGALKILENTNYVPDYKEEDVRDIEKITLHTGFPVFWPYTNHDSAGLDIMNDIAVVTTVQELTSTQIKLFRKSIPPEDGTPLLIAGYGYILLDQTVRQHYTIGDTIINYSRTHEFWAFDQPASPCEADGGGPAFVRAEDGELLVLGITSRSGFSRLCTEGSIYTLVPSYLSWVDDNTVKLEQKEDQKEEQGGCCTSSARCRHLLIIILITILILNRRRKNNDR